MEFRDKLRSGFVLTAEINPPRGVDPKSLLAKAAPLAGAFDALSVTDDSLAKLRMNAMAFAHLVHREFGTPMLMHLTCRDMSLLKLTDYLLGAWALDIHNVVCMTGDPPRIGSFKEMKGVFQLNSFQLCSLVSQLNRGLAQSGEKLSSKPDFAIGCVANPYSPNLKVEAKRLEKKVAGGATYVLTQPIYTRRTLEQFLEATEAIPVKKLIGVLPLRGLAQATTLAESVPDIYMPADIFERLRKNDSPAEGIAIAREFIAGVREHVDGIHLFPLNQFDLLRAILAEFPERLARASGTQGALSASPPTAEEQAGDANLPGRPVN